MERTEEDKKIINETFMAKVEEAFADLSNGFKDKYPDLMCPLVMGNSNNPNHKIDFLFI